MKLVLESLEYDEPFTGKGRTVQEVTTLYDMWDALEYIGSEIWQGRLADVTATLTEDDGRLVYAGPAEEMRGAWTWRWTGPKKEPKDGEEPPDAVR
jgi:hypothetical protein